MQFAIKFNSSRSNFYLIWALTIFCFCISNQLFSQKTTITGIVYDQTDGAPLAYASVFLVHNNLGTTTNTNGEFQLDIPAAMSSDSIMISYIGYEPKVISIKNINDKLKINLNPGSTNLNEVIVIGESALTIIKNGIKRIPVNYDYLPYKSQGFYRVTTKNDRYYVHMSEAVFDLYISKMNEPHYQFHLEKIRSIKDLKSAENINVGMSPESVTNLDDVYSYKDHGILYEETLEKHDFHIEGYELVDGRDAYKISFEPKANKGGFIGTLLMDVETLAFLRIEYKLNQKALDNYKPSNLLGRSVIRNVLGMEGSLYHGSDIDTYRNINGKYYLQLIQVDRGFAFYNRREDSEIRWDAHLDYVVTSIQTEDVKPFSKDETVDKDTFLEYEKSDFDPNFWKDYTIIVPTVDFTKVAKRLEVKNKRYESEDKGFIPD